MTFIRTITSNSNSSDQELIARFKKTGDNNLIAELYQRYMDLVFGVCLKYLGDREKSRDAVMDIYSQLPEKLQKHEVEQFRGWLHVLARNHCLMQLRSPRNFKTTEFDNHIMQSGVDSHLPNEAFEREEHLNELEDCIEQLQEAQKQSIRLFFLEQKCYNEIAEITGFEWNKVRSYIQNGKRNLKICIEEKQLNQ